MLWLSDPRGDPPVFEIDVGLLRPRSRGTVRLRFADPAEPPLAQFVYGFVARERVLTCAAGSTAR
jgi:hypothetical protein